MGTLIGIVIFVVVVFVFYKAQQLPGKAIDVAMNNTVLRGTKKRGEQLVRQVLTFSANAPIDQVRTSILAAVNAPTEPPKVIGGLYLAGATRTQIVYDIGSSPKTGFRGVLDLTETPTGTRGTWEVMKWMESGGIVVSQKQNEAADCRHQHRIEPRRYACVLAIVADSRCDSESWIRSI